MPRRRVQVVWLCALLGALVAGGDRLPLRGGEPRSAAGHPVDGSRAGTGRDESASAEQLLDRILAVVEGRVILLSDVRLFLDAGLVAVPPAADPVSGVLGRLIERRLILEEAARYVLEDPAPGDVAAGVRRIEQRVGGPGALDALLAAAGFSPRDLEQVVRDGLRIERYLARRFPRPTPPSAAGAAARQALIDDWLAALRARGRVIRVGP